MKNLTELQEDLIKKENLLSKAIIQVSTLRKKISLIKKEIKRLSN